MIRLLATLLMLTSQVCFASNLFDYDDASNMFDYDDASNMFDFDDATNLFDFEAGVQPSVIDMGEPTDRQLYNASTFPMRKMTEANAVTYMEALTINSDYSGYDWSGVAIGHYDVSEDQFWVNCDPSLISATHAIGSGHCAPANGDRVYFREPDGDIVYGTVESRWPAEGFSEIRILRFTANPSADLKRYQFASNIDQYNQGKLWCLDYDGDMRLIKVVIASSYWWLCPVISWNNGDSGYDQGKTSIGSGSGKPNMIALDNGEMYIAGISAHGGTGVSVTRVQNFLSQINDILDDEGESTTMYEIPNLADEVPTTDPIMIGPGEAARIRGRLKTRTRN